MRDPRPPVLPFFLPEPEPMRFDGATVLGEDVPRLTRQTLRVYALLEDGNWRTLQEIATETGDPEASISARLRDLRKPRFGAHVVMRRHRGDRKRGCYEYALDRETSARASGG